jgi:hypothetical protein
MLFMPLAYASALDRSATDCATGTWTSFVEAFWSPALAAASHNPQAKAAVAKTASITAPMRARTFLSQAGPRFSSRSSSSWASPHG